MTVTNTTRRITPPRSRLRRHRRVPGSPSYSSGFLSYFGGRVLSSPGLSMGLEKAPNARDLGGYVGAGGRRVRRGLLFRADALYRLSEADLIALAQLKLSCLIDMRSPHEVEAVGADRLPTPPPAQLVFLPLHDPEEKIFVSIGVLMGRLRVADLPFGDSADAAHLMRELYRWFVNSPLARRTFAAAVRIIADPEALPLLFHCTAGKDRTGWLSVIVL